MRYFRGGLTFALLIASACIHRSPEVGIRTALLADVSGGRPSPGPNGAPCSPVTARVAQIMGNEAIASLVQDCGSGSALTRFTVDYLLVKRGQKWIVVKPLSGGSSNPNR